jgi:hypothetical protein
MTPWLHVSPDHGTGSGFVTLSADCRRAPAGSAAGEVAISAEVAPGDAPLARAISVTLGSA